MKRLLNHSPKRQGAFSLIELLLVIALFGILAAIAGPRYISYKQSAYDSRSQLDLRNGAAAEEAYFADNEIYFDCENDECLSMAGFQRSNAVEIEFSSNSGTHLTGTAYSPLGNRNTLGAAYRWNSQSGGMQP
ncbi:MAG TPA: type II secretion system protein [Oligoflexia bacterium]|nr:type II secretion system protein [Oligoflexia bacterium]HMP27094.1 type II secretion system protein [Oligoflexia bacterium]